MADLARILDAPFTSPVDRQWTGVAGRAKASFPRRRFFSGREKSSGVSEPVSSARNGAARQLDQRDEPMGGWQLLSLVYGFVAAARCAAGISRRHAGDCAGPVE